MSSKPRIKVPACLRDPLPQFIGLGLLLFLLGEWADGLRRERDSLISIDPQQVAYLENLYHAQFGGRPDQATRQRLIDNWIREEVLYREALRLGLARQDEIIRRRLVQKMEYLLQDEVPETPDDELLQAYYRQNSETWMRPAQVSFRHIYFATAGSAGGARERAEAALIRLRETGDGAGQGDGLGDRFPMQDHYAGLEPRRARQVFGDSPFSERLFNAPTGTWSGPHASGYGWHLLYPELREEARPLPFEEVREQVLAAWREDQGRRRFESALTALRANYEIVRPSRRADGEVPQ